MASGQAEMVRSISPFTENQPEEGPWFFKGDNEPVQESDPIPIDSVEQLK